MRNAITIIGIILILSSLSFGALNLYNAVYDEIPFNRGVYFTALLRDILILIFVILVWSL